MPAEPTAADQITRTNYCTIRSGLVLRDAIETLMRKSHAKRHATMHITRNQDFAFAFLLESTLRKWTFQALPNSSEYFH